jgi:hypothetical protein
MNHNPNLTEPDPQRRPPATMHAPASPDDDPALARRNTTLAAALWALSLTLFGGTILIAFIYLALD